MTRGNENTVRYMNLLYFLRGKGRGVFEKYGEIPIKRDLHFQ